ncbi:unnamed protein product, partial [Prorocentrum cordatum]
AEGRGPDCAWAAAHHSVLPLAPRSDEAGARNSTQQSQGVLRRIRQREELSVHRLAHQALLDSCAKRARLEEMEGKVRLQFSMGPNPCSAATMELFDLILQDLQAIQLIGSAPKGPLERQVSSMLEREGQK